MLDAGKFDHSAGVGASVEGLKWLNEQVLAF
jgi:hypothetical protein